jgi:hypothetical protein
MARRGAAGKDTGGHRQEEGGLTRDVRCRVDQVVAVVDESLANAWPGHGQDYQREEGQPQQDLNARVYFVLFLFFFLK